VCGLRRVALGSLFVKCFLVVFLIVVFSSFVFSVAHLNFLFDVFDYVYWVVSFVIVVVLSLLWVLFLPLEVVAERSGLVHVEFSELDLPRGRREIVIAALVAGLFIVFRYVVFPFPQGWDTAYYLYRLRKLVSDFDYIFSLPVERVFAFLVLYVLNFIFVDPEITIMVTPVIFVIFFVVGVTSFVWEVTGDHELGFYAGVISAVTFSTSRLFLDLYCNFMAWTFAMFALLYVARIVKRPEPSVKNLIIFSIFSFIIAFTHPWTLFVYLGIVFVFMIILIIFMRKAAFEIVLPLFVSLIPTLIAAFSRPDIALSLMRSIFFSYVRYPFQLAEKEDPLIAFTALLGALYLLTFRKKTVLHGLILAWYITISFLFATGAFYHSFRLLNLMPMGILAAFGLRYLTVEVPKYMDDVSGRLGFVKRWFKYKSKVLVSILLILIVLTALPNSYIPDQVFRPSEYYMGQLKWISSNFGFENKSIIVLVDKPVPMANFPMVGNYLDWAVSEVGQVVYPGSLIDVLQRVHFSVLPHPSTFFKIPAYVPDLILIPDRWYVLSDFELRFARKVSDLGVYAVDPSAISDLEDAVFSVSKGNVSLLSVLLGGNLNGFNVSFVNTTSSFLLRFRPSRGGLKLIADVFFEPVECDYVVLRVRGPNTTIIDMFVSLWSGSSMVCDRRAMDYFSSVGGDVFIPLLTYGHLCDRVRFEISSFDSAEDVFELSVEYIVVI